MIAMLRGIIVEKSPLALILDINGVGYEVFVPSSIANEVPLNKEVTLQISTVVREDAFNLYGFSTAQQKKAFETLRSVNKIGAKLALTILSYFTVNELASAIERKDASTLVTIPGIGKKTAERMCLELKGKMGVELHITGSSSTASRSIKAEDPLQLALAQLDYRKSEIDAVRYSSDVPNMGAASLEDRLRAALQFLAKSQ